MKRAGAALIAASLLFAARAAQAQQCHGTSGLEPEDLGLRAGLATQIGSYKNASGSGYYLGETVFAEWERDWFFAGASLSAYYLSRELASAFGLGDTLIDLRATIFEASSLKLGAELAAVLPLAGSDDAFRMGHFMIMPRIWAQIGGETFLVFAQTGYGGSIGGHDHAGGPRPIVAPMNRSEIEGAVSASWAASSQVRLRSSASFAAPIADETGIFRAAISAGPQFLIGAFDLGADLLLPLAGDPFEVKVIATMAFRL